MRAAPAAYSSSSAARQRALLATAGAFTLVLDGSDVGLDTYSESIDAIGRTADGQLFISTSGIFDALGQAGAQCDLFVFDAVSLGARRWMTR